MQPRGHLHDRWSVSSSEWAHARVQYVRDIKQGHTSASLNKQTEEGHMEAGRSGGGGGQGRTAYQECTALQG
jgi:hypothetical protein